MYLISFIPKLTSTARLTTHIKTLIDNIFDSNTDANVIAGNLTSPISDSLGQFHQFHNFIGIHRQITQKKKVKQKDLKEPEKY